MSHTALKLTHLYDPKYVILENNFRMIETFDKIIQW